MSQPKTEADLRAFRQERTAPTAPTPAARQESGAGRPHTGGLVSVLNTMGYVFLFLAAPAVVIGMGALLPGGDRVIAATLFASAFCLVLAGAALHWMREVLYLLRRIEGRGGP